MDKFTQIADQVLDAEVLWTLNCVQRNFSFYSAGASAPVFSSMFPDSKVAENFKAGKDKLRYLLVHGIHPVFNEALKEQVLSSKDLVLLFDETQNDDLKMKQLDVHLRFWLHDQVNVFINHIFKLYLLN